MSTRDYYTLQLSAYKNLFESQYNAPVTKLAVMPFVLSYNKDNISAIQSEKGIPINYNPSVNVPLISGSRPTTTTTTQNKNVKPAPRPRPKSHKEVIFIFRINGMNSNNSDNVDWGASPNTDELRQYRKPNNGNTGSHWIQFTNGNVLFGQFIPFKYGNIDTNQIRGGDAIQIVFREVPTEDQRKQIQQVALKYWNNIPQLQKIVMDILYPREPQTTSTKSTVQEALPIFKSSLEDQKPIEGITHDHRMGSVNESMGYFEIDGKLHKGYLTPLTTINGIKVYVTKIPNVTKGFGRATEQAHVASNSFYAVFPNGKTFLFLKNNPVQEGMPQEQVMESIKKGLEAKPQKVKELASEKTILFDPNAVPTIDTTKNLSPKEELMRALDIAVTLPKEGSVSYELNLRTATRIRNEILEGTKDDFPIDNAGNPKDLDWYLRSIRKNIEAYKQATAERLKASKEFAGIKSAEEDMRGVIAVQSAALRDLKQSLSHAFYLINNPIETPATINQNNTQTGAAYTAQREQAINNNDEEFEDEFTLKRVNDTESTIWNQEKELNWIAKVLPQLNKNDRIQIVKGLIRVGKQGILAWGQFDRGVITLSDIAAKGTTYHEAFHAVFNLLLDKNERFALYNEYRKNHPNMDNLSLEEEMAEDFREFVMNGGKDTRSLGRKIIDFFKSLFIKTKYWKNFRPSSIYYFRAINEGRYANKELGTTEISKQRTEEYTEEMQNILTNAPRDSKGKLLAPNGKVSNLTERQYAHVRTKAFKEWFGDWENTPQTSSKVVDENGEPLVVYHNTPTPFTVFDMDHTSRVSEQASEPFGHVGPKEAAGRIEGEQLALFLNLRNPIRTLILSMRLREICYKSCIGNL